MTKGQNALSQPNRGPKRKSLATRRDFPPPKGKMPKGNGPFDGLTHKQAAFADKVSLEGLTQTQAYEQVYECSNMARKTIWDASSKLVRHPGVEQRIKRNIKGLQEKALRDAEGTRTFVKENILKMALDNNAPHSVRLKAWELAGKFTEVGLFTERVETKTDRTSDEVMRDLAELMNDPELSSKLLETLNKSDN